MPETKTAPSPKASEPPTPASAPSPRVRAFEVECVNVDSLETAVQIMEEVGKDEKGQPIEAPHACVRRVYVYELELRPSPQSHPKVSLKIQSLDALGFEPKKSYIVSVQAK